MGMRKRVGGARRAVSLLLAVALMAGSVPTAALAQMVTNTIAVGEVVVDETSTGENLVETKAVLEDADVLDMVADSDQAEGLESSVEEAEGQAPLCMGDMSHIVDDSTVMEKSYEVSEARELGGQMEGDDAVIEVAGVDSSIRDDNEMRLGAHGLSVAGPRVVVDLSMEAGQVTTWDCVWFGFYPQTEVISSDEVYASMPSASWDENGDAMVGGVRYRRISRNDTTYSGNWYIDEDAYRYFRWEPIKWRVLSVFGSQALVVADVALDDQQYNTNHVDTTWETSSVRSWLNGYGAMCNEPGTDYSSNGFYEVAFSSSERPAVIQSTVSNADSIEYGIEGGNDTSDKVFLLSEAEVYGSLATEHGFAADDEINDEARRCKTSDYANAMGLSRFNSDEICLWWLRSPGYSATSAASVNGFGSLNRYPNSVRSDQLGVRPALNLNLIASEVSYAGTVSSNGTVDEVNYDESTNGATQLTSISVSPSSYTYDGKAKKPSEMVFAEEVTVPPSSYELSYANNVNAGTATVTVTGKGNYRGTKSAEFIIARAKVAAPTAKAGLAYTGKEQAGVADGGGYELAGTASATAAGSYTATATPDANHCWQD